MNEGYIVQNIHLKRKPIFLTKMIDGAIHLLSCDVLSAHKAPYLLHNVISAHKAPYLFYLNV